MNRLALLVIAALLIAILPASAQQPTPTGAIAA
jgi:hypothetical protein